MTIRPYRTPTVLLVLLANLVGCPSDPPEGGGINGSGTDGEAGSPSTGADTDPASASTSAGSSESGDGPAGCDAYEPGGIPLQETMIPADCEDPIIDRCRFDEDHDGVTLFCDNAPSVPNPAQSDIDDDGIGDAIDLCPLLGGDPNNTADSDRDGIGNACDACRRSSTDYNTGLEAAGVPSGMRVRNNPFQGDLDHDGIGDACDNCPTVPNCGDFGPDNPATLGAELPWDDPMACQADADGDGVGDACEDLDGAGFDDGDDFDGDGLANAEDACPRIPVACPEDPEGPCVHDDDDGDGIGNVCDTCPHIANPEQLLEDGDDDPDRDFVGNACEPDATCRERNNPRAIGFFDVSAGGDCCVRTYPGDGAWRTPDGLPIQVDCEDADGPCAPVPPWGLSTPGVVTLTPACETALELACKEEASVVTLDDVGGDVDRLWSFACRLPQPDVDLDGIGDVCDRCRFGHDPSNAIYVDAQGREWPNDGAVCNGAYHSDNLDPDDGCWP